MLTRGLFSVAMALLTLMAYQNCAPLHEGDFDSMNQASRALPEFSPALSSALQKDCSSCHMGAVASPQAFVSMVSTEAGPWVNLQDPENSLVLKSVLKTAEAPARGMPEGQSGEWKFSGELRSWLQQLQGVPYEEPIPELGPATFSSLHLVLQDYCLSCHSGGVQEPALETYSQVMEQVDAQSASFGPLYRSLASGAMPPSDAPVTMSPAMREAVKDLLFDWIDSGAPNN